MLLCPEAHVIVASLQEQSGNTKAAELEYHAASSLIKCLLATGDGLRDKPYLVLRVEEEHGVLCVLRKKKRKQALVEVGEQKLDQIITHDETGASGCCPRAQNWNMCLMSYNQS